MVRYLSYYRQEGEFLRVRDQVQDYHKSSSVNSTSSPQ